MFTDFILNTIIGMIVYVPMQFLKNIIVWYIYIYIYIYKHFCVVKAMHRMRENYNFIVRE